MMRHPRLCPEVLLPSIAAALLLATAVPASAQMVFDGNIIYYCNISLPEASNNMHNQFIGAARGGAPACLPALNADSLATLVYTHNLYADPLLPTAIYTPGVVSNFRPAIGSPALHHAVTVPNDGWFEQTCYTGAIGPEPSQDWTTVSTWGNNPSAADLAVPNRGWTYYDSTGANRMDLHLPGMPNPRPLAIYDNVNMYVSQTWSADSNYLVRGQLRIKDQTSLTIPAGTVIFGERASLGTIITERGGKIFAVGTPDNPIIMTGDDTPGFMASGCWGGLVMNGRAKVNRVNSCAGDSAASEGGAIGYYGGSDDNDNSGTIRYVRIEYSGKEITPNNELNTFTFNGCGRGTSADYLEAFYGQDDSFEWFGGAMDQKYLIGIDGKDDGYDWQMGSRNRAQFVILRQSPYYTIAGTQNGDKGIEADDNEFDYNATVCSGRSNCTLSNVTFIGDHRVGAQYPGPTSGVNFRRGTAGTVINSIMYYEKLGALKVDDDATWQAHCVAPPAAPSLYCDVAGVPEVTGGRLFVANGAPNPFHTRVNVNFTLPTSGRVKVEVYSADGRLVATLADGEMQAGSHSLPWAVGGSVPSGVYFYKVRAGNSQTTGKITRID
jgi:hypothetical protein